MNSIATSTHLRIPNHYSARLSELDLEMARAVPPGGNWKHIPDSVASARVQKIRADYSAGLGSRSTYYGRLRADAPSYTINTYFSRPGNGCHLHYDYEGGQHRVLSHREAARLQSFPDGFVYYGSRTSISKQIGNAVPPLLAYQIARRFPATGIFVDLFSGAGGLSLGFTWAGWQPVVANDVDATFLTTYGANIHDNVVVGDIREKAVFDSIVESVRDARRKNPTKPLIVLGGPPCQGFSTAGNRRSMDDERNHLFREYEAMLAALRPDGFVFENVLGLLSMEKGKVLQAITGSLQTHARCLEKWVLQAEQFGIPQRRTRVLLVGQSMDGRALEAPAPLTGTNQATPLFPPPCPIVTVSDALSDLPPLLPGEDGSSREYAGPPTTQYQRLMRGEIDAEQYVSLLESGNCR